MAPEGSRTSFNEDGELYDHARPTYPAELMDDLAELAHIDVGSRVCEIGPGTGQATVALAGRGARVLGVELGSELAAVLRRRVVDAPVEVVVSVPRNRRPE